MVYSIIDGIFYALTLYLNEVQFGFAFSTSYVEESFQGLTLFHSTVTLPYVNISLFIQTTLFFVYMDYAAGNIRDQRYKI